MSGDLRRLDRFLLPLEPQGPARYLLGALWAPHGRRERLLRPVRRIPGGPRRLVELLGERPGEGWRRDLDTVEEVLHNLGHGSLGEDGGESARLLLRGYPDDPRERLTAFLFEPGDETPAAVLKIEPSGEETGFGEQRARGRVPPSAPPSGTGVRPSSSAPSPASALTREARALAELAERLPADLASTVPRLLGHARTGGREALLVSALAGRPAYVELRSNLFPGASTGVLAGRHLAAAAAWLGRFHLETAQTAGAWDLPSPEALGLAAPLPGWYRELTDRLPAAPLPAVPVHGDYWARNTLVGRSSGVDLRGVVDWEGYRSAGSPLGDLFQFPVTYGLAVCGPRPGSSRDGERRAVDALRHTFCGTGTLAREVAAYGRRWCEKVEIDPRLLGPLFRCFLRLRARWNAPVEPLRPGISGLGPRGPGGEARLPWGRFEAIVDREERCVFSG